MAPRPAVRARQVTVSAALVLGFSVAYVVSHDGTPAWQALRAALVVMAAVFVAAVLRGADDVRSRILAFALGLLGLGAGGGIAGPHLAKSGVSVLAVAGVAAAVAGGYLALTAAVALVRMVRSWRRVPVVFGTMAGAYIVVFPLTIAVAVTNVPRTSVGSATPAGRGMAYEEVTLDTPDGVALSAWYVPSDSGAAVVLLHGAGSTRSGVLDHAAVLARHGFGVLMPDARGHGRSGGRAMDFGWNGDLDVAGAVDFLARQPDVDPARLAVVGLSMGGEEAIGAAAGDGRIRAVVAEGATGRTAADKHWLSDDYGFRGWVQEQVDRLTYGLTDVFTAARPPVALGDAVVAAAPRPVLLIAAGDVAHEGRAARHIRAESPSTVTVWEVPDTGHTAALDTHPQEWEERVTDFLAAALEEGSDRR